MTTRKKSSDTPSSPRPRVIYGHWYEHAETPVPEESGPYHTMQTFLEAQGALDMKVCGFVVHEDATHWHVATVISGDDPPQFSTPFTIAKGSGKFVVEDF